MLYVFYEFTDTTKIFNKVISFVEYKIYKYKMKCRLQNKIPNENALLNTLKSSLSHYYFITVSVSAKSVKFSYKILKTLADKLELYYFFPLFPIYLWMHINFKNYFHLYICIILILTLYQSLNIIPLILFYITIIKFTCMHIHHVLIHIYVYSCFKKIQL